MDNETGVRTQDCHTGDEEECRGIGGMMKDMNDTHCCWITLVSCAIPVCDWTGEISMITVYYKLKTIFTQIKILRTKTVQKILSELTKKRASM